MSASILPFTRKPASRDRLSVMGDSLRKAYPTPSRDAELDLLIQIASSLLSSMTEMGCDRFVTRLERWEADNRA